MYTKMTINERIKVLRTCDDIKLTLEKFGERIGVKKSALSLIESGKNNVTEQMFKSICREFGVSEEWLRNGTGDMFEIPEDRTAAIVESILSNPDDAVYKGLLSIAETYEQLSPASQKALQEFVDNWLETLKNWEN